MQFSALYHHQVFNCGKHHTLTICACARHLANRIYALLKQQQPYELRDLDNQTLAIQESRHLCVTQYRIPRAVRQRNAVRTHWVEQQFSRQSTR